MRRMPGARKVLPTGSAGYSHQERLPVVSSTHAAPFLCVPGSNSGLHPTLLPTSAPFLEPLGRSETITEGRWAPLCSILCLFLARCWWPSGPSVLSIGPERCLDGANLPKQALAIISPKLPQRLLAIISPPLGRRSLPTCFLRLPSGHPPAVLLYLETAPCIWPWVGKGWPPGPGSRPLSALLPSSLPL